MFNMVETILSLNQSEINIHYHYPAILKVEDGYSNIHQQT